MVQDMDTYTIYMYIWMIHILYHEINLAWIIDLHVKFKPIKVLEENFSDFVLDKVLLDMTPKTQSVKESINKLNIKF